MHREQCNSSRFRMHLEKIIRNFDKINVYVHFCRLLLIEAALLVDFQRTQPMQKKKTWKGKFHVQVPPFLPPVPSEKGKKVEKRCANEKNRKTQQRTSNQIDDLGVVRLGHPRSVNLFNRKVHTRQWEKIIIIFRSRNKNKTRKKCLSFSNKRNQTESNWIPW